MRKKWLGLGGGVAILALAACGDGPTSDDRGYTKAPLETISIFIEPEQRSDVRAFARFNRPDGQRIAPLVADSAGG